jgi:hypothetical protein
LQPGILWVVKRPKASGLELGVKGRTFDGLELGVKGRASGIKKAHP